MLIDAFAEGWIEHLNECATALHSSSCLYLLIDGAFIPGLHKSLPPDRKALLFASLPGCSEVSKDASPLLVAYERDDKQRKALLQRCTRWPMLSAIETPESLYRLAARLAAWCVVEADGQCFNFRFPDTRRLPAIFKALTLQQRAAFTGPMKRWSYMSRDGRWMDLPVEGEGDDGVADPVLDERQFASLVDDGRADELLVLLRDRGHDVFGSPSRSHALLTIALRAALVAGLDEDDVFPWCEWSWKHDQLHDDTDPASLLQSWRKES